MIHLIGKTHKTACGLDEIKAHGDEVSILYEVCTCTKCMMNINEYDLAAGAVRAAKRIWEGEDTGIITILDVIEEETHCAEMLAFIERVAEGKDFHCSNEYSGCDSLQRDAFALSKKVRG